MRAKNLYVLVGVCVFMPMLWIGMLSGPEVTSTGDMEKRLSDLRDRLQFAETLTQDREQDILTLKKQMNLLLGAQNISSAGKFLPHHARELLVNMSMESDINGPGIYHYLPHIRGKPQALKPGYQISQGRTGVSVVIGIPTIKRETSYLLQTIDSMIDSLNDEDKQDCLIVVFVGELNDPNYVKDVAHEILSRYDKYIKIGLLEVIAPPPEYYPNLDALKETFGDSMERVKWRTKQNLDFSFLMMYGRSRGTYYLQVEDDVVTKPGYLSTIKNFALNQKMDDWIILEFSHLGFIGKLFKSSDLNFVVEFFLMFHRDKPIDWLLDHMLTVKVCNPEKDNKHCERSKMEVRRRFRPSLFQHIGVQSSLKGKVQKLKDKYFGKASLHKAHTNPNAEISTTLKPYQRYTIDRAYYGETFFWALFPQPGDTITFNFNPPIVIEKYIFKSGNAEHPGDRFSNTTVEVLPVEHTKKQDGVLDNADHVEKYPKTADRFLIIGHFDQHGEATGDIEQSLGSIHTMRLRQLTESKSWVILNEIFIKTKSSSSSR